MIMYKENMSRYCLPLDDNSSASENACSGEILRLLASLSAAIERITIGETRSNMQNMKERERERRERKNRSWVLEKDRGGKKEIRRKTVRVISVLRLGAQEIEYTV